MQQFGPGAPQGYSFQYSNCTGRRKALLIGINYFGQKGTLRGCINDVKNMSAYLNNHFGYKREDMVILTDDQQNPMSIPTKANMLRAMHWLVRDARPNDSLFFHYSGHGGQTPDLDGDEDDGYDEVIYPVDFRQAGHIVDDEMHRIMVQPLAPGVRLTCIFDSCHSGSALDLPYIYSTQGILKEPNLAKEAGKGLLGIGKAYLSGDMGSVVSGVSGFFKKATRGEDTYQRNLRTKTSPADVVMWSGSKDEQTSADAQIAGTATGEFEDFPVSFFPSAFPGAMHSHESLPGSFPFHAGGGGCGILGCGCGASAPAHEGSTLPAHTAISAEDSWKGTWIDPGFDAGQWSV